MGQRYEAIPINREQQKVLKTGIGIVKVNPKTS